MISSTSEQDQTQYSPQSTFSDIVEQFLEQWCDTGPGLQVKDEKLFSKFRLFWRQTTKEKYYPTMLGQYRVELTQRGFRSNGAKRPRWYGLTLRTRQRKRLP